MFTIEVQGLGEAVVALREVDRRAANDLCKRVRDVVRPTLAKARGYASGLGSNPSGGYAHSLALRTSRTGAKFVSTDPGGGVIEFANPGALILTGERAGRRAGVPHGSNPPRALLKAILEDEESIVESVNREVIEMCDFDVGSISG